MRPFSATNGCAVHVMPLEEEPRSRGNNKNTSSALPRFGIHVGRALPWASQQKTISGAPRPAVGAGRSRRPVRTRSRPQERPRLRAVPTKEQRPSRPEFRARIGPSSPGATRSAPAAARAWTGGGTPAVRVRTSSSPIRLEPCRQGRPTPAMSGAARPRRTQQAYASSRADPESSGGNERSAPTCGGP